MRSVPGDIAAKLSMLKQTKANNADPWAQIFITRPTVPLINEMFLERSVVAESTATDVSIAVAHPRRNHSNTDVWVAYAADGMVTVTKSPTDVEPRWTRQIHSLPGTKVSIAFDGTMPMNNDEKEFITEDEPWLFWVDNGALYAKKISDIEPTTLALENCTDISAVRASWSEVGRFDFGLCIFFIMSGAVYYRQLVNGEWMDSEVVTALPTGHTWTEVSASRTWDYRLVIQVKDTEGAIFELYTQYMGFGANNTENINIDKVEAEGDLQKIDYISGYNTENVEISNVSATSELQWGIPIVPVSANTIDDGTGNFGVKVKVIFDHETKPSTIAGNETAFQMVDSADQLFNCENVEVGSNDLEVILTFIDFNAAVEECTISYIPGTMQSRAGIATEAWNYSFVPTGLVPPMVDPPVPIETWNE